ncbi:MAG: sigma-70 family RNA polymerase sigma factor [Lentisphaerae bacterium]|nr:sigma-70 family RNA polymerase sigma factor [Lentisphaerota bacterium]
MEQEENNRRNLEADALIQDNMRLVLKIANDFLGRGLPWDDLVSEGNRGLVIAAHRFNPDLGAKFSTYSAWWIKQAIRQALAEQTLTIRVPVGTQLNSRRIKRSVRKLKLELDRNPTNEEVAADANVSMATVERLRDTRQVDMQSLNELVGADDSDGVELQDFFADESSNTPDKELIKVEDLDQLLQLLDGLPPKEKQVLKLRFGMDGSPVMTLEDVGNLLNCTSERVRQIQNQALKRLHRQMLENA